MDAAVTLVGLLVPLATAIVWALSPILLHRPAGRPTDVMADPASQDDRARNSWKHAPVVGVKVLYFATHVNYYREVWQLGPAPRGWHRVAWSATPLTGRHLPSALLVSGDLADRVSEYNAGGWPFLTDDLEGGTLT